MNTFRVHDATFILLAFYVNKKYIIRYTIYDPVKYLYSEYNRLHVNVNNLKQKILLLFV